MRELAYCKKDKAGSIKLAEAMPPMRFPTLNFGMELGLISGMALGPSSMGLDLLETFEDMILRCSLGLRIVQGSDFLAPPQATCC